MSQSLDPILAAYERGYDDGVASRTPILHVLPVADLVEHVESRSCPCGPDEQSVTDNHWIFVHHSLDGREQHE